MKEKQNKFKEIHLRVPLDLYEEIEKNRGDLSKNEIYTDYLFKGIEIKNIEQIRKLVKSMKIQSNYIKLLVEQIYADLDFEKKDVTKSKNLMEFKEQFIKKNHK